MLFFCTKHIVIFRFASSPWMLSLLLLMSRES